MSFTPAMLGELSAKSVIRSESKSMPPEAPGSISGIQSRSAHDPTVREGYGLALTVIDDHGDRALLGDLRPERLEGLPVVRKRTCEVPAQDDDGVVRAGLCRLFRQLDGLPRAARAGARDDRDVSVARVVQRPPSNLDEGGPLIVG